LAGADALLPALMRRAQAVIADKAYDAKERVLAPLERAEIEIVIPPRQGALEPRTYDRHLLQTAPFD
jgi:hypothetical protein